ncbi:MAG: hypothetical protein KAR05_12090 [Candidatus Omnitrophica bacterium]|nr:hypothetical protein [Candidatus Omnitrophota bacterium]
MPEFKIDERDLAFLDRHIDNPEIKSLLTEAKSKGIYKAKGQYETNTYILHLNEEELDKIVDVLSDLFTKIGLQKDDEPNPIGLKIEDMIDFFNDSEVWN